MRIVFLGRMFRSVSLASGYSLHMFPGKELILSRQDYDLSESLTPYIEERLIRVIQDDDGDEVYSVPKKITKEQVKSDKPTYKREHQGNVLNYEDTGRIDSNGKVYKASTTKMDKVSRARKKIKKNISSKEWDVTTDKPKKTNPNL